MISKETVQHIAKLARLGITPEEEEKFSKDLSSILDYFEKLKKVDTSKVGATTHSIPMENVKREDVAVSQTEKTKENLIGLAPVEEKKYIKVKSVF